MTIKVQIVDSLGKVIDEVPAEVAGADVSGNGKGANLTLSFPRAVAIEDGYRAVMFAEQVEIAAKLPAKPAKLPAKPAPAPATNTGDAKK